MADEAFDEHWQQLLSRLVLAGAAPAGLVALHPHTVAESVRAQWGAQRPELPEPVQKAVVTLHKKHKRSLVPETTVSGNDLLMNAASYAGITGDLKRTLARTRNAEVTRRLAENPDAPVELLQRLATSDDPEVLRSLAANPGTPNKIRAGLISGGHGGRGGAALQRLSREEVQEVCDAVLETGRGASAVLRAASRHQLPCYLELLNLAAKGSGYRVLPDQACTEEADVRLYHRLQAEAGGRGAVSDALAAYAEEDLGAGAPTSVAEWVESLPLGSEELDRVIVSDARVTQNVALRRVDVGEEDVLRALQRTAGLRPKVSFGDSDLVRYLSVEGKLQAARILAGSGDKRAALTYLSAGAEKGDLEVVAERIRELKPSLSDRAWEWRSLWRTLIRRHGQAAYGLVTPAGMLFAAAPASQVAPWLLEEAGAEGVETVLTLGPTWDGSVHELLEAAKALRSQ